MDDHQQQHHPHHPHRRQPDYRLRRATIALLVVILDLAQIPLYQQQFGDEIVALLGVRMLLTMVVAGFFLRRSEMARILLGAVRALAFSVGFIMGLDAGNGSILAASILDLVAAVMLFRMRFNPPPAEEE